MPEPAAPPPPVRVAEALQHAAAHWRLDRLDAQLLLLNTLGRDLHDRAWIIAHDGDAITPAQHAAFRRACERRSHGEPLAYIVGEKEFYGLRLRVDARALVPRPDTEALVDWALEILRTHEAPSVLDLGTGSGAIALAIKSQRPDAQVFATDASAGALQVAQANARQLGLAVHFTLARWLDHCPRRHHLIVSNPPYIAAGDPHLAALGHEPASALTSGTDGLDDIRTITAQASAHLHANGWLLLEHGFNQAETVRHLLQAQGYGGVRSRRDTAGILRCSGGQWPSP